MIARLKNEFLVYLWGNAFALFNVEAAICYTVLDDILGARSELIFYIHNGYKVAFGKKRLLEHARKYGDLFLREKIFQEHVAKMNQLFARRERLIKEVNIHNLSKLSSQQLFELAEEYQEIFCRVFGHMAISRPECVDHLSEELLSFLSKKNKNKKEVNHEFAVLISPTEMDVIKKEKLAKLKILSQKSKKARQKYILEFPWVYGYKYAIGEALQELEKDLKKINKKDLAKQIAADKSNLRKLKVEKERILKKYNDPKIKLFSERLSFLGHNRLEVKARFAGLLVAVSPLFQEIAKRGRIDLKEMLDHYLLEDIRNLLFNNIKLLPAEIGARKDFLFATSDNAIITLRGDKAIKFRQKYLDKYLQYTSSEVKGTIASKGYIVGRCRKIILGDNMKFDEFKKGEILVTEMTAPSMVPLMDRCVGIITNEGGIVSHAAIISREFHIPCLVGTGTATQAFTTGDYLELDANQGIARKINEVDF